MNMLTKQWNIVFSAIFLATVMMACSGGEKQPSKEKKVFDCIEAPVASAEEATDTTKININAATEEEFRTIPDVGDKMVHEFDEYRPYASIRQFRKEIGKYVDEAQVAAYEQSIYVPIKANESDAATLMQIPGLDEQEAKALISGRPYATAESFTQKLSTYINEQEMLTAKAYMRC